MCLLAPPGESWHNLNCHEGLINLVTVKVSRMHLVVSHTRGSIRNILYHSGGGGLPDVAGVKQDPNPCDIRHFGCLPRVSHSTAPIRDPRGGHPHWSWKTQTTLMINHPRVQTLYYMNIVLNTQSWSRGHIFILPRKKIKTKKTFPVIKLC